MSTTLSHDEIEALAEALIAAILANDTDAVIAMYTPDATVWHNFDGVDQTPAENCATLAFMHKVIPGFGYHEVRRTILDDGFWQQHLLRGTGRNGDFAMPAALRVRLDGDKIARLEEYLDPSAFTAAISR